MARWIILSVLASGLLIGCVTETSRDGVQDPPSKTTLDETATDPVDQVEETVRRQIEGLGSQSGRPLLRSVQTILAYKELARKPVLAALVDADDRTRAHLIYCLGFLGGREARAALVEHLGHRNPVVRFEAAAALTQQSDFAGVPVLIGFLDTEDRQLRYKSFEVLKSMSKNDFGYDFQGDARAREESVGLWRGWWAERRRQLMLSDR